MHLAILAAAAEPATQMTSRTASRTAGLRHPMIMFGHGNWEHIVVKIGDVMNLEGVTMMADTRLAKGLIDAGLNSARLSKGLAEPVPLRVAGMGGMVGLVRPMAT